MWLLAGAAVLLGPVGGVAAVVLFKVIGLLTHLTLLHDFGWSLPTLRGYHPGWWIVPSAMGGALVVSAIATWSPVIRGHGIPESLEAILVRDSRIRPRAAVAKPVSAAVTIGTGGPFGAEGPIIVTGGSIGSLLGQLLSVSPAERKILLATGAAAGMSATFNAPLASVILAVELVLFERSLRTMVPLSIACSIAAGVHVLVFGSRPLFMMAPGMHVALAHLPLFGLLGIAAGVLAVLLNKGLFAMEAAFRRLPVRIFWWPLIGALGYSLIGLVEPRTLSMGYSAIDDTLNGRFALTALLALFGAKLLSWWIALGSQTSGGTLAPMFLVGATMGSLLGHATNRLFPALHVSPEAFALVAMGATFGAATQAIFASVVFAAEVTGEYQMVVPLLLATAVAELVVELFLSDRLMTEKLTHRGFRVDFRAEVDALRMRVAQQVMREPIILQEQASVATARALLADNNLPAVAVVDGLGRYRGLLTVDALARAASASAAVAELLRTDIPPIQARDHLHQAVRLFNIHQLHTLPVVSADRVVGQLDRDDIAAEHHRHHTTLETRQPGWGAQIRAQRTARRTVRRTARQAHRTRGGLPTSGATAIPRLETPRETRRRLKIETDRSRRSHADNHAQGTRGRRPGPGRTPTNPIRPASNPHDDETEPSA